MKGIRHAGVLLLIAAVLFLNACGRKAPLTLKAYEKPEAPARLAAIHREDAVILSWSYPEKLRSALKGFRIVRSEGDTQKEIALVESDRSSFSDTTFAVRTAYTYQVIAINQMDVPSDASPRIALTPMPLPKPPQKIRVTVKTEAVELSWNSSGEGVCYNIYRTAEKSRFPDTPLNKKPVCATSFKDSHLAPDGTVFYTIRPLHNTPARDEGHASQEIPVGPADYVPSPPQDVKVATKDNEVTLVWKNNPEPWVKGYRIYRKTDEKKGQVLIGEVKVPHYTDKQKAGKKVWYVIKAVGPSAESTGVAVVVVQ